jgi:hypothetical protein
MNVDIRYPIGGMFAIVGVLLVIFGLTTAGDTELYARSLNINMNLWWGGVLTLFGAVMLVMAWRAKPAPASPDDKPPEGRPH